MKGSSKKIISENIGELIRSGRKPDQAAAISYKKAGKARRSEANRPSRKGASK